LVHRCCRFMLLLRLSQLACGISIQKLSGVSP
jgi:hypothetical protein